jgi:hypothetical protein
LLDRHSRRLRPPDRAQLRHSRRLVLKIIDG